MFVYNSGEDLFIVFAHFSSVFNFSLLNFLFLKENMKALKPNNKERFATLFIYLFIFGISTARHWGSWL